MTEKEKELINTPAIIKGDMTINEFFKLLTDSLEELGQYREIGTLKELKELREAVHCNAFTDGYKKGSTSMLKEFERKIEELEKSCEETYGCKIVEMYVEIVLELKKWIKHLN